MKVFLVMKVVMFLAAIWNQKVAILAVKAMKTTMSIQLFDRHPIAFSVRNSGPRNMQPANSSPITYFYLFITTDILRTIVSKTKTYADQSLRRNYKDALFQRWTCLGFDVSMLKKFLGLINMGLEVKRRLALYWDTKCYGISTPFFSSEMSRNTFQLISSFYKDITSQTN